MLARSVPAMTELGVVLVTGVSLALAFACRSERFALARVLLFILGLVVTGVVVLAVVAFGQHDAALAVVVLVDVALLRWALVLRGRILTARLIRLRQQSSVQQKSRPQ